MKDRMAHEKTKRRLDVLNGVPGFINKLINHERIDNKFLKEILKALPRRITSTFTNSMKHLTECKLLYLIHFLDDYRLISQVVAISSEITLLICHVTHLIRIVTTKVRLKSTTCYLVNQTIIYYVIQLDGCMT